MDCERILLPFMEDTITNNNQKFLQDHTNEIKKMVRRVKKRVLD